MKICVVQARPEKGDVETNLRHHLRLIPVAVEAGASMVFFPELSLTGYEPHLARQLATTAADTRFSALQEASDAHRITIAAGMPLLAEAGINIGMLIFQPDMPVSVYAKQYLHDDELPFFVSGTGQLWIGNVAPSICYELSVPQHAANARQGGAAVYVSSSAKTAAGAATAHRALAATAAAHGMITLFSNCVGHCDNFDCGGGSAAWGADGALLGMLDNVSEGLLIVDTDAPSASVIMV